MVQLATICYINGQRISHAAPATKTNDVHAGRWIGCRWLEARSRRSHSALLRENFRGNRSKGCSQRCCPLSKFTPDLDWYTYVFKVSRFEETD